MLVIMGLWIMFEVWPTLVHGGVPRGDIALIALHTRDFLSGDRLVGPYSRFGFAHPGPLFFAWYALGLALPCSRMGQLLAAQLLLNVLCGVTAMWLARRAPDPRVSRAFVAVSFLVLLAVSSSDFVRPVADVWGPVAILFPLCTFVLSIVMGLQGVSAAWLVAVLTGSACAQNHLGALAPVVATGVYAVAISWWRSGGRAWQGFRVPLAALVLVWLPPLVEATRSERFGNIGKIARFATSQKVVGGLVDVAWRVSTALESGALLCFAVVAGVVVLCVAPRRSIARDGATVALVGMCAVWLAARNNVGEFHPYLFYSLFVFVAVVCSACVVALTSYSGRGRGAYERVVAAVVYVVLIGLCMATLSKYPLVKRYDSTDEERAQAISRAIVSRMTSGEMPVCFIQKGNSVYEDIASVLLVWRDAGRQVFVEPRKGYLYGRYRTDPRCSSRGEFPGLVVRFESAREGGDAIANPNKDQSDQLTDLYRDDRVVVLARIFHETASQERRDSMKHAGSRVSYRYLFGFRDNR
jgi:hypothetical protein